MASVKVYPRLDKKNLEGKAPVYLRVTKNRKSKYIALDTYVLPADWNKEAGKLRSTATNASHINTYISSKVAEAEKISLELETKSKSVTSYDIKSRILGRPPEDFFMFVTSRDLIMKEEFSVGTYRRYKCVVEKFKTFSNADAIYFDDINVTLIKEFQQYLLINCKNHVNTVHANLKVIRKLLSDAAAEGLIPFEKKSF